LVVLMSRWGGPENLGVLEKIIARLGEANAVESGSVVWLDLRWYPLELLSYSGGVAAVSARNYAYLNALFLTNVPPRISGMEVKPAIMHVVSAMRSIELDALFKRVPGHERQFVPLSEYLFKAVQPVVEDLLFLGGQYDQHFDRFELLQALTFADLKKRQNGRVWGPIGRFAWKHARGTQSPFSELVEEAKSQGDSWGPIRAGMFGGSSARFLEVAGEFLAFMETLSFF